MPHPGHHDRRLTLALESIVVVGASLAGVRAAETLRRDGFSGRLTLVGAERHWPPYDRPPLSKQVLDGSWPLEKAALRVDVGAGDVDLRLGVRAVGLDLSARCVTLEDGTAVAADGVVVATGAAPRTLPGLAPMDGVHVVRTVDDSVHLRADLDRHGEARVAVVGAGFIGCEVAAAARRLGHPVTLIEALPLPLGRVLGDRIGRVVADLHRAHGVDLHLGIGVARFAGDERVEGVELSDGNFVRAPVVVVGIGVMPATGWLEGSGVVLDNGVVCDETLAAVGVDGVVACGDVARWPHPLFDGDLVRIEHWTNAAEQGEHAARTLLARAAGGVGRPFAEVPYFWSDQHGTKFQMVGANRGDDDVVVVEGSDEDVGDDGKRRFVAAFVRGPERRVVAAMCVNRANRTIAWRQMVADRATL